MLTRKTNTNKRFPGAKITEPFEYIIKSFEDREIQSAIEMALYKHRAEERLRESQRCYATTLTSIGDGLLADDSQGWGWECPRAWDCAGPQGCPQVLQRARQGTTFRLLFPASAQAGEDSLGEAIETDSEWRGTGTVLLVDDDETILGGGMPDARKGSLKEIEKSEQTFKQLTKTSIQSVKRFLVNSKEDP